MTPTHANKRGVRYRYYVSQVLLTNRGEEAGSVPRVPAPEIETAVLGAIRAHLRQDGGGEPETPENDRDLIERQIERIVIKPQDIEIRLVSECEPGEGEGSDDKVARPEDCPSPVLSVAWTGVVGTAVKGILHSPSARPTTSPDRRAELLSAIAKARVWIEELVQGRATSFAEIAEREGKAERHIRFLAPLAFVSPRVVLAIAEGSLAGHLNATKLVKSMDCSWAEQERRICGDA